MPASLSNADIQFRFESPLHDAIEEQKGQKFLEAHTLLAEAVALDQSATFTLDFGIALRDALSGIGVPEKWIRTEDEVKQAVNIRNQQLQTQQLLDNLQQGSEIAKNTSEVISETA